MRTTLDLDDDILASAKEIARIEKKTAGRVLSELARRALTAAPNPGETRGRKALEAFGFRAFASRGKVVTNDAVDRLRQDGEY